MIDTPARPTDTMLEKIVAALQRDSSDLFSTTPTQKYLQDEFLAEFAEFINLKLKNKNGA